MIEVRYPLQYTALSEDIGGIHLATIESILEAVWEHLLDSGLEQTRFVRIPRHSMAFSSAKPPINLFV